MKLVVGKTYQILPGAEKRFRVPELGYPELPVFIKVLDERLSEYRVEVMGLDFKFWWAEYKIRHRINDGGYIFQSKCPHNKG